MSVKSFAVALNEAMRDEMRRDDTVVIMGEDIAGGMGGEGEQDAWGGAFAVTKGLLGEFGRRRVVDTPISEGGYLGLAAGACNTGLRVVAEIMYADFFGVCFDQLLNNISKFRYVYDGQATTPITIRCAFGAGQGAGATHGQTLYSMLAAIPGLKVVVPSSPADAKGLLAAAIRDNDPVIVFEHILLYRERGEVPDEPYVVPIGKARLCRDGGDATILAVGAMVKVALDAAEALAREGIECSVIDPRSIVPLDLESIRTSVERTGRLVIVDESPPRMSFARDVAAQISALHFGRLKAPVGCINPPEVPVPAAPALERAYLPDAARVAAAVKTAMEGR